MSKEIDIYNANLERIGRMDRREAHRQGHWHRSFHCWVFRGTPPALLFQLRSPNSQNFPNALDVSAAGHLDAGESVNDGVRELHEELGVEVSIRQLIHLGERVEVKDEDNGQKNREYQSVFAVRIDNDLSDYKPRVKEVWGLMWLPIQDGMKLMSGEIDNAAIEGIRYDPGVGEFVKERRIVNVSDFLPRLQRYYLAALISAERLLEGKQYVAIS